MARTIYKPNAEVRRHAESFGFHPFGEDGIFVNRLDYEVDLSACGTERGDVASSILAQILNATV